MVEQKAGAGRKRRRLRFWGMLLLAVVAICGITLFLIRQALQGERREPRPVLEGVAVYTLEELPGKKAYPDALTIGPDRNIYVGSFCTGEIWRLTPEGTRSTFVGAGKIKAVAGLAFAPNGWLYVADRGDCDPRRGVSKLKRISPDGKTIEQIGRIDEEDIPNALAFDRDGVLYITDTQHSNIRRLNQGGILETWWELPSEDEKALPTGLVYDAANDAFFVADTANGTIYRVGIDGESRQPLPEEILYQEGERELEGLALDDQGRLIFTLFDVNKVARRESDGSIIILAENFREPSEVAYLDERIYVTNFDGISLAPVLGWLIDPSLPFTVDVIDLREVEAES